MLASLKRLTKHSAIYGVGHIVTRVVNFLLVPLYTHQLATDEFGASASIYAFVAFMTPVYTYGIDAAFLRYFILNADPKRRRRVFSTAFWAVFVVGLVLTLILFNFSHSIASALELSTYANLIRLGSLILLFDALAFLPFLYLRAEEKSQYFIVVKLLSVLINVALNLLFIVKMDKGVEGIFLANVWASALTFLMLSMILLKHVSFRFDRTDIKQLLSFGLPFLPSVLAVVLLDTIDKVLMTKIAGLELTGIYNAGFKLGMIMALVVAAFRFAWHPFFLTTSKQEDAREVFAKVLTYFVTVGACIFLVISFFIEELVKLDFWGVTLIGREYWAGTKVVPLILLSYLLYGVYINLVVGIFLEKKTKYLPIITGAGVAVNIVANLVLIPMFDMMGAASAKVLGYLVMCVLLYGFAQRAYPIPYEFGRLTKLVGIAAVVFFAGQSFSGDWSSLLKVVLLLGFPLLLFITGFFEKIELDTLKLIFKSKLLRLRKS